jgi:molecular chaperone DnaK
VGDQTFSPTEVSAQILTHLKRSAEEQLGEPVDRCVITVPANFPDPARRATQQAGEIAGMTVERIINEPTAAALAYGYGDSIENQHILVYDLGGGTFDVSVVEYMGDILDVKASSGDKALGGKDFDEALVQYVSDAFEAEHGISIDPKSGNYYRLLFACEDAKKDLSFEDQAVVNIPFFTVKDGQPVNLDVTVTRDTFEGLIGPMIDRTESAIETALSDANLNTSDIDQVILVGGSTRIPYVQNTVERVMGQRPLKRIDPDKAVALGAAVQTAIIDGTSERIVMDVVPLSLGTSVLERSDSGFRPGRYNQIIPRNGKVLKPYKKTYNTVMDDQELIDVRVYQRDAESNAMQAEIEGDPNEKEGFTLLGRQEIDVPPGPMGQRVEVTYTYDHDQMVEVEVYFPRTEETRTFRVHAGLNEDEIMESKARLADSWRESDFYAEVEALIDAAEHELQAGTVPNARESELEGRLSELKHALAENDEPRVRALEDEITDLLFEIS